MSITATDTAITNTADTAAATNVCLLPLPILLLLLLLLEPTLFVTCQSSKCSVLIIV